MNQLILSLLPKRAIFYLVMWPYYKICVCIFLSVIRLMHLYIFQSSGGHSPQREHGDGWKSHHNLQSTYQLLRRMPPSMPLINWFSPFMFTFWKLTVSCEKREVKPERNENSISLTRVSLLTPVSDTVPIWSFLYGLSRKQTVPGSYYCPPSW